MRIVSTFNGLTGRESQKREGKGIRSEFPMLRNNESFYLKSSLSGSKKNLTLLANKLLIFFGVFVIAAPKIFFQFSVDLGFPHHLFTFANRMFTYLPVKYT